MKHNELTVKSEYNSYTIIFDEKGTAVYMELKDQTAILCKSWNGHKPDLAMKLIFKENIFV